MLKLRLLVVVIMLALLSGCTRTEEQQVSKAVEDYNRTLIQVFSTGQLDLLNSVASEQEARRIELYLKMLNSEQRIMHADLKDFNIVSTKPVVNKSKDGKKSFPYYQVLTKEVWVYSYINTKSLAIVEGPTKVQYQANYDVVQPTGKTKWVVNKVSFQEQQPKQ